LSAWTQLGVDHGNETIAFVIRYFGDPRAALGDPADLARHPESLPSDQFDLAHLHARRP